MKTIFPRNYKKIDDDFLEKIIMEKYERIYVGSEFCFNLFPSFNELKSILKIIKNKNLNFSIITPPLFQNDYLKFIKKIDKIIESYGKIEIIINDIGLLNYLKYKDINKVSGRALSHLGEDKMGVSFLKNMGVELIESDDLSCFNESELNLSIYYPYRFMQTTRNCIIASIYGKCERECLNGNFSVTNSLMREEVLYFGNGSYIKYDEIIGNKISRIVTERLD